MQYTYFFKKVGNIEDCSKIFIQESSQTFNSLKIIIIFIWNNEQNRLKKSVSDIKTFLHENGTGHQ